MNSLFLSHQLAVKQKNLSERHSGQQSTEHQVHMKCALFDLQRDWTGSNRKCNVINVCETSTSARLARLTHLFRRMVGQIGHKMIVQHHVDNAKDLAVEVQSGARHRLSCWVCDFSCQLKCDRLEKREEETWPVRNHIQCQNKRHKIYSISVLPTRDAPLDAQAAETSQNIRF